MSLVVAFSIGAALSSSTFLSVKTILTLVVGGVEVGAGVCVRVCEGTAVAVTVRDIVAVGEGVRDGVVEAVAVRVREGVAVAVLLGVNVAV